jgi:hypothetical protein
MTYPTFDAWLATLSPTQQAQARRWIDELARLGAPDPGQWVRSELSEGIAQRARFLFLRGLWDRAINRWIDSPKNWIEQHIARSLKAPNGYFAEAGAAMDRLVKLGASPEDLGQVARYIAYSTAFDVVHRVDETCEEDASDEMPGWALIELDAAGSPTGRAVGGLHEDLLNLDPSGRDGNVI